MNNYRKRLEELFANCNLEQLKKEFQEPWMNDLLPGLSLLEKCNQGSKAHLEGNVAIHTCLVFDNFKKNSKQRLNREPDFIEMLATILHDFRKPQTSSPSPDGSVSFPHHEISATIEIPQIAKKLDLNSIEITKLTYLVGFHGIAHFWPDLEHSLKEHVRKSEFLISLAAFQEADALSCYLPNDLRLPVFFNDICN